MKVCFRLLLAFILLFTLPLAASHIDVNKLSKQTETDQTLKQLYFQITDANVKLDDLLSSAEAHRQFQPVTQKQQVQFKENQAVWFYASIANTQFRTINPILEYHFPPADQVEIYQVNRENQDIKLLSRAGNDLPFYERMLPYRSYAVNLTLARNEQIDVYIKVLDAAIVPSNIRIWQPKAFIDYQQQTAIFDGILQGVMWLLAFYNLLLLYQTRDKLYLYNTGFFISFSLTFAVLNGMAFAFLWPMHPEINQATLYLSVGATLLMFNLAIRHALRRYLTPFWRGCNLLSSLGALALLFSPLYASGELKLLLLFICTSWILLSNFLLALFLIKAGKHQSKRFIWISILTAFSAILLTATQAGYLNDIFNWPYILLALILFSLALTSFNLQRLSKNQSISQLTAEVKELKQYHDIFHNAVEGLFITRLNGQLINANTALASILGYDSLASLKKATEKEGMNIFYTNDKQREEIVAQLHTEYNNNFETQALRADGSTFWVLMSARLSKAPDESQTIIHGSVIDITEKKQAYEQLNYLANHDPLTALFNRHYFEQKIQTLLAKPTKTAHCILFIDIDQFRLVNSSCNHSAGDVLLEQISDLFKQQLDSRYTLARLDGDEFAILLTNKTIKEAYALAYSLIDAIKEFRFIWQENIFIVSLGIGITEILATDISPDAVIKRAGAACTIAKQKGQNRIQLYDANDQETQRHHNEINWVSQLRHAVEFDQFVLYQQIIKPLTATEQGLHYEILLRLRNEDNSLIGPDSFMGSAERYGLMPLIDRWVIKQYFHWLQQHPAHLKQLSKCCINLSGSSLIDANFKQDVQTLFHDYNIAYSLICFEITETVAIVNLQNTVDFINHFRKKGCQFSLDDFGSGFSSYGYLKNFPADYIKIDGHFVRDLLEDPYDKAIVKSIHDIAQALGMRTVAEYVENERVLNELKQLGINYAQGYGIARPQPLANLL